MKTLGIDVWLDEWEIRVGDPITQKIQLGINESDFVAVWLTKHSVRSGWVEREWQSRYGLEVTTGRVTVLPLLGERCDVPALLRDKKYADFAADYLHGLEELLAVLPGTANAFSTDRLVARARDEFRIGDSSYISLVQSLTSLCRRHGTIGLAVSARIVKEYTTDLRDSVIEAAQRSNPSAPASVIGYEADGRLYAGLLKECGPGLMKGVNPYHLPCAFHPCIHLTSALVMIRQGVDDVYLDSPMRDTLLARTFSCMDFWIAFFRVRPTSLHAPQERLMTELFLCAAALREPNRQNRLPGFLRDVLAGQVTLPTFSTDFVVTGTAWRDGERVKEVESKIRQVGGMSLSTLAMYLFGRPEE
jgi:hypothetical protein